ncbi:hypothetical protein CKO31_12470 [Thiohalocapsa halophila]|uniref:DUF1015 domain-containing protein n=1 Tax=Thiohalocapsa halophila TaxID=69359 RepID=A0ABS1CIK3_9GAMM|nr:DUF1015 family protein [Thiohalocapsa halophila]MBK1631543.1 hypothetical protein [Thiohalocapsa halophila]
MSQPPLLSPFPALRPAPGRAAEVIAPPYDVVDADEARDLVAARPHSFLHISRAEVDLPAGTDPYAAEVYEQARANLDALRSTGVLRRDPSPCFYAYRLDAAGRSQTGLVAGASVAAYMDGRIKKHELTRPAKEDDRVCQIAALDAHTGPAFLVHRAQPELRRLLAQACEAAADVDVRDADGVRHRLWVIADTQRIAALTAACEGLDALYVADGHHRSAAAARVAAERGDTERAQFLAVAFPDDELRILPYNRVIRDLAGHDCDGLLARAQERFAVTPCAEPVQPTANTEFGLYCGGGWWRLRLQDALLPPADDPVASLAVSLLHTHLVEPVLGITDPRRDPRIDFVGGSKGVAGLTAPVDAGRMQLALSLPATGIDELLAVADAGAIMPPKSTWFEPKLADGLVSLMLDAG